MDAENTTLYFIPQDFSSNNFKEIVNYELGKITTWLNFHKLSFNTKTNILMMVNTKQQHINTFLYNK